MKEKNALTGICMNTKALLTADDLWKMVADGSRYEQSEPRQ